MSPIRILQNFRNQSDQELAATAATILNQMSGNASFPNPSVDLKDLQTALDDFISALASQAQGGTVATALKKQKRDGLITLLGRLAHHVQDNCGNNVAAVLSSGFCLVTATRTRSPLEKPSILSVDYGNTTQLVVRVRPVARAKCYEVQAAAIGAGGVPGSWQSAGLFTSSRAMVVNNLIPGTTYSFQVRAVGGSNSSTPWSDPVSHMCP